jgi:hypothetical protein
MTVVALVAAAAGRLPTWVVRLADETPEPEDVKAGWTAFIIFLLLIAAVVLLAFSLVKQLRKAQAAEDAGVYGHDDDDEPAGAEKSEPENHSAS